MSRILAVLLAGLLAGGPSLVRGQDQATGALRGTVFDADFNTPLEGVRVSVVEALLSTVTGEDGRYLLENIPPGTYTVSFAREGFQRAVRQGVVVTSGSLRDLGVELSAEVYEMEELVVTGEDPLADSEVGALEIRAESMTLQDSISSELMTKAGSGTVDNALKLVTGVSIVDGQYPTVRGLSDRYTGTTMNGIRVPSADPRRRAVQVDQFPTGTVENVTVTKTFTPDLQGDFTGGGVNIHTKAIPEGPALTVQIGSEYNSLATNNPEFLSYQGGGVNATAHDSSRDLPADASDQALASLPPFPRFTPTPPPSQQEASEAYDSLTRSFAPTLGVQYDEPGFNQGLSINGGNRFEVGRDDVIGVFGALTWGHKYDSYDGATNNNAAKVDANRPMELIRPRNDNRGVDTVLLGLLGTIAWQPDANNDLVLRAILNQTADDQARLQIEESGAETNEINQSLNYTERQVFSLQAHGEHRIGDTWDVDWSLAGNSTSQDEPDVRFFRYVYNPNTQFGEMPSNSTDPERTRRIWRNGEETNDQVMVNATRNWADFGKGGATLQGGLFLDRTDRKFTQRSFSYTFPNQSGSFFDPDVAANFATSIFIADSPDQLWTDVFLDADRIGLSPTRFAPNQLIWTILPLGDDVDYDGQQDIDAFYLMSDMSATEDLKFIFGARYESTKLAVQPSTLRPCTTVPAPYCVETIEVQPSGARAVVEAAAEDAAADIDESTVLPSVSLAWEMRPSMNLRAAWSQTIARPTFRELAPVATEEFIFGDEFFGNPDLVLSSVTNYDLRWEWFRRPGEVLAASVFYKDITDPIELLSFGTGNRTFIQPVNYDQGQLAGFELEARSALDFITRSMRHLFLGFNYTKIESSVDVPQEEQDSLASFGLNEAERQLQGQPDSLINVYMTFESPRGGSTLGLFYNKVGEMLITGAARSVEDGIPNVFQSPFETLDFTYTQRVTKSWSLRFRARNLLQDDRETFYRTPDGEEVVKTRVETAVRYALVARWQWGGKARVTEIP